jgi:hypothetical protein
MRRFLFPLLALIIAGWFYWSVSQRDHEVAKAVVPASGAPAVPSPAPVRTSPPILSAQFAAADFPLAAQLNAPAGSVAYDLDVLRQILEAWRTNFPHDGNPVGENNEITAALGGRNPLNLVLIPRNHPAINDRGELCDRWGTPFRFHQLSGTQMEIHSAGPDRKFGTADDAVWSPGD